MAGKLHALVITPGAVESAPRRGEEHEPEETVEDDSDACRVAFDELRPFLNVADEDADRAYDIFKHAVELIAMKAHDGAEKPAEDTEESDEY